MPRGMGKIKRLFVRRQDEGKASNKEENKIEQHSLLAPRDGKNEMSPRPDAERMKGLLVRRRDER